MTMTTRRTTLSSTSRRRSARATCSGEGVKQTASGSKCGGFATRPERCQAPRRSHAPMTFTFTPTCAQQYRAILTMQVQSRGLLLVNLLFPASGVVLLLLVFGGLHRAPSLWEWTIV